MRARGGAASISVCTFELLFLYTTTTRANSRGAPRPHLHATLTCAILQRELTDVCNLLLTCNFLLCRLQRELKKNIKRARTMNLIPYKSKLPQFQKSENPFLDS